MPQLGLVSLPIELLYEIQLLALSEHLPHTCRHLHRVYKLAPISFNVQYILGRFYAFPSPPGQSPPEQCIVTRCLRYPLCHNEQMMEAILQHPACPSISGTPELSKRLFRFPRRRRPQFTKWGENDAPIPFLRYLYNNKNNNSRFNRPSPNAHDGFALTQAVSAGFIPLVRFLLKQDASPRCDCYLAITVAIDQRNLPMVRLLVERGYGEESGLDPGVRVSSMLEMLQEAISRGAEDIAKYFVEEKHLVPDLQTIELYGNYLVKKEARSKNKTPKYNTSKKG